MAQTTLCRWLMLKRARTKMRKTVTVLPLGRKLHSRMEGRAAGAVAEPRRELHADGGGRTAGAGEDDDDAAQHGFVSPSEGRLESFFDSWLI